MNGECGGAQLAQQCAEPSGHNPQINQMQDIQINVKGSKFRLKCSSLNEEKKGKDEEKQEKQPKAKKRKGNTVKSLRDLERPSKCL